MATDDPSLMDEVREQTDMVDGGLLSDSRLSVLISNAKREIGSELADEPAWYEDANAENALFWLVCLFVVGEDSDGFSIGELQVDDSDADVEHPWVARYERSRRHLMSSESLFGIRNVSRSDREPRRI